jgi:methionine-rich copper-binding protein CopC
LYYRLKQVDYDGEFAYTEIRTVELNKLDRANASLSPNPFTDNINITINEPISTSATVHLIDGNGKQIRTYSIELNAGTTQYEISQLGNLSSGMYFVTILTASGNSYNIKVIRR